MLSVRHNRLTGERELHLRDVLVETRIVSVGRTLAQGACDWRLWVARAPGCPATVDRSPMRLVIESRLRGWLLRRYRCRLLTSKFATLRAIAERERAMSDVAH